MIPATPSAAHDHMLESIRRLEEMAIEREYQRIRRAILGLTGLTTDDLVFRDRVLAVIGLDRETAKWT